MKGTEYTREGNKVIEVEIHFFPGSLKVASIENPIPVKFRYASETEYDGYAYQWGWDEGAEIELEGGRVINEFYHCKEYGQVQLFSWKIVSNES